MLGRKTQLMLLALAFAGSLLFVSNVLAASQWVTNPASCNQLDATNYPGQNCNPTKICGDFSNMAQCYNTASLPTPGFSSSTGSYNGTLTAGGYVVNCYAAGDAAAPFCDNNGNYWCNADASCQGYNRITTCVTSTFAYQGGSAFSCSECKANFGDCDTNPLNCEIHFGVTASSTHASTTWASCATTQCMAGYHDCNDSPYTDGRDGDGCEKIEGASCIDPGSGLTGTQIGCSCVLGKQFFETDSEAIYATSGPFLWGRNYGLGDLIKFGNATSSDIFTVSYDGVVSLATTTAPVTTTDKLYNLNGDLYWNGVELGGGATTTFTNITWVDATSTGNTLLHNLTVNATSTFSTITAGIWQGGIINPQYGGTGQNSSAWDGFVKVIGGTWGTTTISVSDLSGSSTLAHLDTSNIFTSTNTFNATTTFTTTTAASSTITTANIGNLYVTGNTYGINLADITGSSSLAYLANNQTFTGQNTFSATTTLATTTISSTTITNANIGSLILTNALANTSGGTGQNSSGWNGFVKVTGGTWSTTSISVGDLVNSSTLAYLSTSNTFSSNITVNGDLVVSSTIRTNQYCDANGTNCFDPSINGWSTGATSITTTVASTTGSFTASTSLRGYQAANYICDQEFEGYHFCFTGEIIGLISKNAIASVNTKNVWIAEGPPGYTADANDCAGYTSNSESILGTFWIFNDDGGGMGWRVNCGMKKSLACCK